MRLQQRSNPHRCKDLPKQWTTVDKELTGLEKWRIDVFINLPPSYWLSPTAKLRVEVYWFAELKPFGTMYQIFPADRTEAYTRTDFINDTRIENNRLSYRNFETLKSCLEQMSKMYPSSKRSIDALIKIFVKNFGKYY